MQALRKAAISKKHPKRICIWSFYLRRSVVAVLDYTDFSLNYIFKNSKFYACLLYTSSVFIHVFGILSCIYAACHEQRAVFQLGKLRLYLGYGPEPVLLRLVKLRFLEAEKSCCIRPLKYEAVGHASPYFRPAHGGQGTLGVRPVRKEEA